MSDEDYRAELIHRIRILADYDTTEMHKSSVRELEDIYEHVRSKER